MHESFELAGICARCTQPVGYIHGRLTDASWDEERCWPHDDPNKTHIVRDIIIADAIDAGSSRPEAVWNAMGALLRAERATRGAIQASCIKSSARLLASGRADS